MVLHKTLEGTESKVKLMPLQLLQRLRSPFNCDMHSKLDELCQEASLTGLKLIHERPKRCDLEWKITHHFGAEDVDRVYELIYLGSVVLESGGTDVEINSCIAKAQATFARKLKRRVKLKITLIPYCYMGVKRRRSPSTSSTGFRSL